MSQLLKLSYDGSLIKLAHVMPHQALWGAFCFSHCRDLRLCLKDVFLKPPQFAFYL